MKISLLFTGISRDKTMDDKLMHTPNLLQSNINVNIQSLDNIIIGKKKFVSYNQVPNVMSNRIKDHVYKTLGTSII